MALRLLRLLSFFTVVGFGPMAMAKANSLTDQFFYRKVVEGESNSRMPSDLVQLEKDILTKLELRGLSDLSLEQHDIGRKEYHLGKANSSFKYMHVKVGNISRGFWRSFTFDLAFRQEENEFDLGENDFKVAKSCTGTIASDGTIRLSIERCLDQLAASSSH